MKKYRAPRRGLERIKTSWSNIDRILDSKLYNDIEDEVFLPRRSQRIKIDTPIKTRMSMRIKKLMNK